MLCEGNLFLCIAKVNGLFLDNHPVNDILISDLSGKAAHVSYQGLRLVPASYSDDHNGNHDWKSMDLFLLSAKVPGTLIIPINPDVVSHNLCDAFFLFQSSELMALAASLQDEIHPSHHRVIPQVKPSDCFLYREQDGKFFFTSIKIAQHSCLLGKACFMLEHTGPDTSLVGLIGLTCPNCQPTMTFNPSL